VATVAAKLDEWKRQLLDLSKRNRLLHFRETKRQTLRVELPSAEALFQRIAIGERPITVVGLDAQEALNLDDDVEDAPDTEPKPRVVSDGEILFEGSVERIAGALYTLRSRSKTELEERGIGVLYLAFGFLRWFEADHSDYEIVSPLVLVPVDLQRETALDPYRVVPRDDDVVLNPTLRKVLEDQFKVQLPDLPEGEGWALHGYLDQVRKETSRQARWSIDDDVFLSVFSFLKLNMYRDLVAGVEAAESSAIIQALAGDLRMLAAAQGEVREIPADELDARVDPADCLQVLDADSSQQQAIELAKAGASFVLQGPPGTGKSQTIANIIAELLGLGRTVLFVSEKAAALDVVHRRLTQVGLADGCLALHSHKANKRDVVSELARTYSLGGTRLAASESFNYARLRERRTSLNKYVIELHTGRAPLGMSVFQVEGLFAAVSDAPEVPFALSDPGLLTMDHLEEMRDSVARLAGSATAIATLSSNPWRGATLDGLSLEVQRLTRGQLVETASYISNLIEACVGLARDLGLEETGLTVSSTGWMIRIARALAEGPEFMGEWLVGGSISDLLRDAQEASEQHGAATSETVQVTRVFKEDVLEYDLDGLAARLAERYHSFFARLGGEYRQECRELAVLTQSGKKPTFAQLSELVPVAISLRARRAWIDAHGDSLRSEYGRWYSDYQTNWDALLAALSWTQQLMESFDGSAPDSFATRVSGILAERDALRAAAGSVEELLRRVTAGISDVNAWFEPDAPTRLLLAESDDAPLQSLLQTVEELAATVDDLGAWNRLAHAIAACEASGIGDPLSLLEGAEVEADEYADALTRRALTLWLDHWIGAVPVLRDFEASSHAHIIEEFRRLDGDLKLAARRTLAARLAERRPHPSAAHVNLASSQPAILMKEAKKKRRHKPLRRLFAEIPDLLVTIKPCMMMSPLSVGQFLPIEAARFDAVVFDEASQVKPEDAVGAIMRGKQLIVVGDSKQLPPSSFFDVSMSDEFDEDGSYDDDTGAYESILDLCGTVGLSERMLEWHYRSRREGLIAFSNHFLYNDRLVTFPAPEFNGNGTGVEFRYVVDGVYDRSRTRTNALEVQEVLSIIRAHAAESPEKTLGVVAFSQAQMTAIDTALWRLRSQEPILEAFFGNSSDEPFFVKNLENVQGDERDVIVFSVGYGRDAAGKLGMNFGPLNNRGGERRLNVAVTRAREKVVLVSSIRGADVDLGRTQSEGVRLLKHYLDYAERGVPALDAVCLTDPDAEFGSPFEEQVARVLENAGYRVEKQVGCSGYRIDLAIVHPERPGQYALGIECDGASYHSAATARERDRLREQVLVKLGWKLHRIWSTDWFRARAREVEKLLVAVESAISDKEAAVSYTNAEPIRPADWEPADSSESESESESGAELLLASVDLPPGYSETRLLWQRGDFYLSPVQIRNLLIEVVKTEGPVHIDRATKRVASAWGIARAGSRVQGMVKQAARGAVDSGVLRASGMFLFNAQSDAVGVRRNVEGGVCRKAVEIAPEEIAEAARLVLRDQIKLSRDDLILATARVLGFDHTGSLVRAAVEDGLKLLVATGLATEDGGCLSLA